MVHKDDGNLYFLNRYMNEQELEVDEYGDDQSDREEFSGEELYDMFDAGDFEGIVDDLKDYNEQYPNAGFDYAKKIVDKYLKLKNSVSPIKYLETVAGDLYRNLQYWFDSKWLVTRKEDDESIVIDRVGEVISDIIYREDTIAPEEFIETYMLAYELSEYLSEIPFKYHEEFYGVARNKRFESAIKGLTQAGITKEFVLNSSPDKLYNKISENNKEIGRVRKRLQVEDSVAKGIQESLWIDTSDPEDVPRVYAEVCRLYYKPTTSQKYPPIVHRINELIKQRKQQDNTLEVTANVYKEEGLVIYKTNNSWIVVGGGIRVFVNNGEKEKLVFNKPLYKVRVKDLEKIVKGIK